MKKFKYKIVTEDLKGSFNDENDPYGLERPKREEIVMDRINSYGENGWELVNVTANGNEMTLYFKKEIKN